MSLNSSASTLDLLSGIFQNIALHQFTDFGTCQSLLLQILNSEIQDPKELANEFLVAIGESTDNFPGSDQEDKVAQSSQLLLLTLENLLFNLYSKLKTNEVVRLQDSIYHTQASISFSILNLDASKNVLQHGQFNDFLGTLLGDAQFYDEILKAAPKVDNPEAFKLIAMQVNNLISTFDYITEREEINVDVYKAKRSKFLPYMRIAPSKAPVKDSIKSINSILFSGDVNKLVKLISSLQDRQSFIMSTMRILHYYRRNTSSAKHFDTSAVNGQEVIQRCINAYISSKTKSSKDYLFRENRSTEPLFDIILSYMIFHFLPVLRSFDDYVEKHLMPYSNLNAAEFYARFVTQSFQQGRQLIESWPVDFKDFLRKIFNAINSEKFSDKLAASSPIKTLVLHRFFFNLEIRALLHKVDEETGEKKQDQIEFMKVSNYFKDLFYESSLKKYSYVSEFSQAHAAFNALFDDILNKKRGFKSEMQVSNYLKFYITKPLLRYDYAVVKHSMDKENNPSEYSDNFENAEDSFYDEKLEKGDTENAKPFTSPEKGFPNFPNGIVISGDKKSKNALKKIMNDSNFSESDDEDAQEKSMEREREAYAVGSASKAQGGLPQAASLKTKGVGNIGVSDFNRRDDEDVVSSEERKDLLPAVKTQLNEKENRQMIGSNQNISKDSRRGDRSYDGDSYLERRIQDNNSRVEQERRNSNEEKTILKNRLGVLEDKYAMLVETLGHYKNSRQGDEMRPDITQKSALSEAMFGGSTRPRERKKVKKEDDEFYKLHEEIMKARHEALQSEIDFVMHKRTNFPSGFY